jgi:hypothetical protein
MQAPLRMVEQGIVLRRDLRQVHGNRTIGQGAFLPGATLDRQGLNKAQGVAHGSRRANGCRCPDPLRLGAAGNPGGPTHREQARRSKAEKEDGREVHQSAIYGVPNLREADRVYWIGFRYAFHERGFNRVWEFASINRP